MTKKLFTLLLAIAASIGTIFAESGTCGNNLTWDLTDSVLTISGTGAMNNYSANSAPWYSYSSSITSAIVENGVTSIGSRAFMGCWRLTSVTIPNSVTYIGYRAFYMCNALPVIDNLRYADTYLVSAVDRSLSTYTIKDGTRFIGDDAFSGCRGLTSIAIPNSVIGVGTHAFDNCTALPVIDNLRYADTYLVGAVDKTLSTYTIKDGTRFIGWQAFSGCTGLTSVTIPNSVTSIGWYAFSGCSGLTSVTIPNSVTSIGCSAFSGCSSLTKVNITDIASWCNILFEDYEGSPWSCAHHLYIDDVEVTELVVPSSITSIGWQAFSDCTGLTSVTIPEGVTCIGGSAFSGCTDLTSVAIGNSVTSIGAMAFYNCTSLKTITCDAQTPSVLGNLVFYYSTWTSYPISNIKIYVPCGTLETYQTAEGWSEYASQIKYAPLPYKISTIAENGNVITTDVTTITICKPFVTCTAIANYGYHFSQWSDGNTENPRAIELTQDTTFTAEFAKNTYTISTTSANPEWGTTAGDTAALYLDEVEISAIPNYGYRFVRWDDNNTSNPRTVIVTGDKTYTAVYAPNADNNFWPVQLNENLGNVVYNFNEDQENVRLWCWEQTYEFNWINNSLDFYGEYGNKYAHFRVSNIGENAGWTGAGYSMQTSSAKRAADNLKNAIIAHPNDVYLHLSVKSTTQGTHRFYLFGNDSISFVIGNKAFEGIENIVGDFQRNGEWTEFVVPMGQFASLLTKTDVFNGNDNILVVKSEPVEDYELDIDAVYFYSDVDIYTVTFKDNDGSILQIEQVAKHCSAHTPEPPMHNGYSFTGWNKSFNDIEEDVIIIAEFAKNTYTISTSSANPEWGTTAGDTAALYLDEVEISAIPNYGYHFVRWNDNNTSNPRMVYVTEDKTYTASFAKNIYSITKNAEHGDISGNNSAEYLDFVTLTVTPDYGYHFTQWSDGLKDNPRIFQITKDTAFTAEFAPDRVGTCGKDLALVWSYDPANKVLTIGNAGSFTENMQFGLEAPNEMEELVIGNSVTAIGANAFAGIETLKKVSIGESVKTIGEQAFYNCVNLETIFNYRPTPTNTYSNAFDGVDKFECVLYVLPSSIDMYKAAAVWRDFYYTYAIGAEEATVATNDVQVEPQDNAATLTWPTSNNAATYTIQITKDGVLFCTLIFNANGQLTGIAFAPSREGSHHAPAAIMTANGLQFTVTGLDSGTQYGYNLTAKDANDQPVATYSGEFTTTSEGVATGIEEISSSLQGGERGRLILHNGQIYILRGEKVYTLQGQEVK